MLSWTQKLAPIAVAALMALGTAPVSAATIIGGASCSTSDVTGNGGSADACLGKQLSKGVTADLNADTFVSPSEGGGLTVTKGLFGYTDWSLWGSSYEGNGGVVDVSGLLSTSGGWEVAEDAFDDVLRIVVVLSTPTSSSAYLFENPSEITSGTWNTDAFSSIFPSNRLINIAIYTSGVVAAIPLPAGALLLLTGIGAFGAMSRRKRKTADAAA